MCEKASSFGFGSRRQNDMCVPFPAIFAFADLTLGKYDAQCDVSRKSCEVVIPSLFEVCDERVVKGAVPSDSFTTLVGIPACVYSDLVEFPTASSKFLQLFGISTSWKQTSKLEDICNTKLERVPLGAVAF